MIFSASSLVGQTWISLGRWYNDISEYKFKLNQDDTKKIAKEYRDIEVKNNPNLQKYEYQFESISVIGMVSIMYLSRLNQEFFEMYIPELIVTKNYRNQGIGKKMIQACIKLARDKKCHRIRLESGNQRKKSHIFYKNLGFSQSCPFV